MYKTTLMYLLKVLIAAGALSEGTKYTAKEIIEAAKIYISKGGME
jgi:hypothetical protein